jgi:hypothetical protein
MLISVSTGHKSGDLNDDGMLSAIDLNILRNYLIGKETMSAGQMLIADMNNDGQVDVADIIKMLSIH